MKRALVGLSVLAAALVLGLVLAPRGGAAEKGPIRIGLLTSKTGVLAIHGAHQMAATEAFKDKYGTTVAGRKVEFYAEDDQSKVPLGVTKVRKLITGDKAHIVMGGLFASTGYAIAPLGDQYQTPIFVWSCPDDLSQRKRFKFVVKYFSCSQPQHAMAHWLRQNKPQVKKVIIFGPDYAFGYESSGGFQKVFEDMGGQVVQKIYAPINTVDYGPYIGQFRKDADGMFVTLAGPQALRFPKQYQQAGLRDKYVLVGNGTNTDEFALAAQGEDVLGWITAHIYGGAAYPSKDNREFVTNFKKHLGGKDPGYYAEGYYGALVLIYKAIEAIKGDVENKAKFMEALGRTKVTEGMPAGPKASDGYGNLNTNVYIRDVRKDASGKLYHHVLHVYENVTQFWTYKPEEFLKQPVYEKDFPPCKFCQ